MDLPDSVPTSQPATISAVSIKIPPLWRNTEAWFAHVEAQFATAGITTSRTKFNHVVAALSAETTELVLDVILNPTFVDPFDALRDALIARTAESNQANLERLISHVSLGDRKPSQLLREMRQLLGHQTATTSASFLRDLFVSRLPKTTQAILAATAITDADVLADLADKVLEANPVTSISTVAVPTPSNDDIVNLADRMARIESLISNHFSSNDTSGRSRVRRPASRNSSPGRDNGMCWYHNTFGNRAQRCREPCSFRATYLNARANR